MTLTQEIDATDIQRVHGSWELWNNSLQPKTYLNMSMHCYDHLVVIMINKKSLGCANNKYIYTFYHFKDKHASRFAVSKCT